MTPNLSSSTKQTAFSSLFLRKNAGNFGGNTFVNLEAARMAISSNVNDIGDPSAQFWADGAAKDMETVWSSDDGSH
jgi:hypothetical protein